MAPIAITESELLDALAASAHEAGPEHARTIRELSAATNIVERRVRNALRVLQAAGRLQVHRVTRTALDGRAATVPAYTILPAAKAGKRRA